MDFLLLEKSRKSSFLMSPVCEQTSKKIEPDNMNLENVGLCGTMCIRNTITKRTNYLFMRY